MKYYPGQILFCAEEILPKGICKREALLGIWREAMTSSAYHSLPALPRVIKLTAALPGIEKEVGRSKDKAAQIAHLRSC